MSATKIKSIIFDLGGVLIDWNPRYVFHESYFGSVEKRDYFLGEVCTMDWNEQQDAGYPIAQAIGEKIEAFPEWEKDIRAYYGKWQEMLKGPIQDTVDIFAELKRNADLQFYALTNWSAELFPVALQRYDFLKWFDGIVVSGEEKMRKPAPEFYQRLLDRYHVKKEETLFIDDNLRNIHAAKAIGLPSIQFENAEKLRKELKEMGVL